MTKISIESATADQILRVPIDAPEILFSSVENAKKEYRKLSMRWHPDHMGDETVFKHIKELYEVAEKKIAAGIWQVPGLFSFTTHDGKKYEVRYRKHRKFELGHVYISDSSVVYMLDKSNADLADDSVRSLKGLKYADAKMKTEFSRYLPEIILNSSNDAHRIIVYKKTPDLLSLRDVLAKLDVVPTQHVAWILSSLYNLACFLKYNELSHNGISLDTYFISPKHHSGALLGGWWYTSRFGQRIKALPKKTMDHCSSFIKGKIAVGAEIDLQLISVLGLELLGDEHGSKILAKVKADPKKYPSPFISWLRTPLKVNPDTFKKYAEYKNDVLIKSWGKPKFFDLKITAEDLYE